MIHRETGGSLGITSFLFDESSGSVMFVSSSRIFYLPKMNFQNSSVFAIFRAET